VGRKANYSLASAQGPEYRFGYEKRYHSFLEKHIPEWKAPTPNEETANPIAANAHYNSAIRWLLEYTRDKEKFPLVFIELAAYGFRRNLYGLKPYGITIVILSLIANIILFYCFRSALIATAVGVVSSLVFLIGWLAIIRRSWVKDAAFSYTRALLSTCEMKRTE
jgi:hypothetical protein